MRIIDADILKEWIERQGDPANEPHYNTALADVYDYIDRMPTAATAAPEREQMDYLMRLCYAAEIKANDRGDAALNADDNGVADVWAEVSLAFGEIGDAIAKVIK